MRVLSKRSLTLRAAALLFLCAPFVAGCAAPAVHPVLDQAGAAVERARSAPRVRALAAAELDRAEMALEHARAAAEAGAPPDQVEHLAYIVSQRAALAEARAAERVARAELGKLQRALGQPLTNGPRQQGHRISASREQDQRARAWVQEDRPARAPLEEHQRARAWMEQDRGKAAAVQEDQQARAPLEEDQ